MEQKSLTLRECLIGDRTFYRHVAVVVLPIIVQNTLSNVVSLLDNVMVGQVGTLPMSAVAIINQLLFVFNLCIWGALAGAGIEMIAIDNRERLLKTALDALSGDYDYIFIDCPPSLELLTVNALCAAGSLLVPVQCEYYALEGLSDLLATVRLVKRGLNPALTLEGVLLTMFDSPTNLTLQVAEEVKRHFPGQVYATVIPRNVRLSEAPSHGRPISAYDPYSRGAEAYRLLADEIASKR